MTSKIILKSSAIPPFRSFISPLDLQNNQYSMDILRENIYAIQLLDILKTQTIDEQFAVDFILNKKYQFTHMEEAITINDVLLYQTHMKYETLMRLYLIGPTETFRIFETKCE